MVKLFSSNESTIFLIIKLTVVKRVTTSNSSSNGVLFNVLNEV